MTKILLIIPAIFLLLGLVYFYMNKPVEISEKVIETKIGYVEIELEGEVIFPGYYEVIKGTTLKEVIDLAFGFTDSANPDSLSLARKLEKNETISVPKKESSETILINLNKASYSELLSVPNITEKRAAAIIIYREQYGLFKSVEELLNVKYIGVATYEKVKEYFTVG